MMMRNELDYYNLSLDLQEYLLKASKALQGR